MFFLLILFRVCKCYVKQNKLLFAFLSFSVLYYTNSKYDLALIPARPKLNVTIMLVI